MSRTPFFRTFRRPVNPGRTGLAAGLLVLAAAATASPAALGDLTELPLEQLLTLEVSTASKFAQPLREAPSAVTVITAADIRAYGYRTLADILRSVPGLYITDDRNYSYVGARGFARPGDYNTRVLLLVDGYRVNEGIYDGAYVDTSFIVDVGLIERVEFAPGPGSAIYGGNAFFGVVNVITRNGKEMDGGELVAAAGSYDSYGGRVSYGQRSAAGLDVLVSASGYASEGEDLYFPEFDDPVSNNGVAVNLDGDRSQRFFGKLAWQEFTFETGYSSRTKDIPTASYFQVFNQPGSRTTDDQYFASLRYERALAATLDLQAMAYYGQYEYYGQYMYGTANQDGGHGAWWGTELRLLSKAFAGHKLLVGGEFRHDLRRDQENYDTNPFTAYLWDNRSKQGYAVYAQDEWSVTASTIVNLGVRHDGSDEDESSTNPRLALIQKFGDKTTAKLLYGTAFRSPNAYEKYYVTDSGNYKQNPNLGPEDIKTAELVLEHYLDNDFRVTGSVFSYRIDNLISLTLDSSDGLLVFENLGEVSTRGVELQAERVWAGGARLRASYSRQQAEDEGTGQWLPNSPDHLAKLNLTVPLAPKWFAGVEWQYVSERLAPAGARVDAYSVTNLTLRADQLVKNLEIAATAFNLFDADYADPASEEHADILGRQLVQIPQNGRNVRLKLTYRF